MYIQPSINVHTLPVPYQYAPPQADLKLRALELAIESMKDILDTQSLITRAKAFHAYLTGTQEA